ncbi:MAG: hypothetical protein IJF73_00190 [Clostridia bacterium]|nr:hypothetical protein [Clostridia bacterium]
MDNRRTDTVNKGEYEIDLRFFAVVFRKCWLFILLAAVIVGLVAGIYTSLFIPKKYSSTVKMYVDPNAQSSSSSFNNTTAEALAEIYPPVLRNSDEFARAVALAMAKLEKDGEAMFPRWTYTVENGVEVPAGWSRVRSMMSTGISDKLFYITISSEDPREAYEMAKIAAAVAPELLNETVQIGVAKVISQPVLDTVADSPSVPRNSVLAAAIAAVLVYLAFFLRDLFDTTVYAEEDLVRFELPILGTVPSFPSGDERADAKKTEKEEKA